MSFYLSVLTYWLGSCTAALTLETGRAETALAEILSLIEQTMGAGSLARQSPTWLSRAIQHPLAPHAHSSYDHALLATDNRKDKVIQVGGEPYD
jgi:hypothetical protein